MAIKVTAPLSREDARKLKSGDSVLLSGVIYTARDAAHKRLMERLDAGEELPFDLKGSAIYYVGPTPERPGEVIGSAGPTTSGRMDAYSPRLLDRYYRLKAEPRISFAGQMTGVEGYVESAASGFLVGVETARRLRGMDPVDFPQETALGALGLYVSNQSIVAFQPMNINFGIIPPLDHRVKGKRNKNAELSQRSLAVIDQLKDEVLR